MRNVLGLPDVLLLIRDDHVTKLSKKHLLGVTRTPRTKRSAHEHTNRMLGKTNAADNPICIGAARRCSGEGLREQPPSQCYNSVRDSPPFEYRCWELLSTTMPRHSRRTIVIQLPPRLYHFLHLLYI